MQSDGQSNGKITAAFGTARVEIRELSQRECIVTHSAQIRVGTTGSLVLRNGVDLVSVRASVLRSSLLAPSLDGMVYRSTLRIDAGDGLRIRQIIPPPADEALSI